MNKPFSYELDERQIKLLMLNGECDDDGTAWDRFEAMPIATHSAFKMPLSGVFSVLNVEMSRSVIIPLAFVGLIGGLSALLFKLVDFKKQPSPSSSKAVSVLETIPAHPSRPTNVNTQTLPLKPIKLATASPTASAIMEKTVSLAIHNEEIQKTDSLSVEKTVSDSFITTAHHEPKKKLKEKKKRKKRELISEELPSINAAPQLIGPIDEPDLELK